VITSLMLHFAQWPSHAVSCLSQLHIFSVRHLRPSRGFEAGDQPDLPSNAHPGSAASQAGATSACVANTAVMTAARPVIICKAHQTGRT